MGVSGWATAPAFQGPSSQIRNWGQLGSSRATRSPLATPSRTRAAANASLSRSSSPWLTVGPLNSGAPPVALGPPEPHQGGRERVAEPVQLAVADRAPLEQQGRRPGPLGHRIAQVVQQGPLRVRPKRLGHTLVVVLQPLHAVEP